MTQTPISTVTRPLMKLRARLDRISTLALRTEMGLGYSQYRILLGLSIRPDITQKYIADFWDVTEASVSRQVKILEKNKLIERSKNHMLLTTLGKKTLAKAKMMVDGVFEEIFADVDDTNRKHLTTSIEGLLKNVTIYQSNHNQNI